MSDLLEVGPIVGGPRSDRSIASFGDRIFDRDHDGQTVNTDTPDNPTDPPLLSPPTVRMDLTGMDLEPRTPGEDDSLSMSTMAHTTESTRLTLRSTKKHNERLAEENENQSKIIEASEQAAADLQARLDIAIQQLAALQSASKPKKNLSVRSGETTDTAAAGIGRST